ncbi:hypothetical protein G9A89_023861 [Geosiphon pyriformis]|nr:hypothetical protein G9A89_023861 [Geosiphon pyriformis]
MPKKIQLPIWKKQRIKSPPYPSYYHIPRSTINITSADLDDSHSKVNKEKQNFGISDPWKVMESEEEEEEETEDQEFTYQNPITENLKFETRIFKTSKI